MSAAAFDNPLLSGLLGDEEFSALFATDAELAGMVRFEIALARAEGAAKVIPQDAADRIAEHLQSFRPKLAAIRKATARDGTTGPEFIRQLRAHVGEDVAQYVHVGATSQDVVDTSLVLRLKTIADLSAQRLATIIDALEHLSARYGAHQLMGRTRMQDALPIAVGARIESWSLPQARHLERLEQLKPRLLVLQFGGAVGTLDVLGNKGRAVGTRMAKDLGLRLPKKSWHTQRDNLAEFASWLSLVTGTLGKMGQDIALMTQAKGEIELSGVGGSSAMAHKRNPVKAEVLVALARHNAGLLAGMHQALVSENERSGAAWTLEWLTLSQMVVVTGAALRTAIELIASIKSMGTAHG
jgi:3-carboxy-cis,cis-muconate cycloisomerase